MKTVRWLTPLGCVMLLGSAILHSSGYIRLVHRIEAAGIQFPLAGILKVCWRQHRAALLLSGRLSGRLPACGCHRALPDWRLAAIQTKTSRLVLLRPGWARLSLPFHSAVPLEESQSSQALSRSKSAAR